jgi:transcription initiation factor TFIIIB Brf1 subunit/transcription initiation factor TFIIB
MESYSYDLYDNSKGVLRGSKQMPLIKYSYYGSIAYGVQNQAQYKQYTLTRKITDSIRKVTLVKWGEESEVVNLAYQVLIQNKSRKRSTAAIAAAILYIARKYKKPIFLNQIIKALNVKKKALFTKISEIEELLKIKFPRCQDHIEYFEMIFSKLYIAGSEFCKSGEDRIYIRRVKYKFVEQAKDLADIKEQCKQMLSSSTLKDTLLMLHHKYYVPAIVILCVQMSGYALSLKHMSSSVGISVSTISRSIKAIKKELQKEGALAN